MSTQTFEVHVTNDQLKFNAAHFIAYKGFREALHGHNYRMSVEVAHATYYDPQWTNYAAISDTNSPVYQERYRYALVSRNVQQNLHDLRLVFRWPLFNNDSIGNGKQTYRTMVGGYLMQTNDAGYPSGTSNLFYFQPRNYVKAP